MSKNLATNTDLLQQRYLPNVPTVAKVIQFCPLKQDVNDGPVMEMVVSHQTAITPRHHTATLPLIRKSSLVRVLWT